MVASVAEARLGWYAGGSIVLVDLASGTVVRQLGEMRNGLGDLNVSVSSGGTLATFSWHEFISSSAWSPNEPTTERTLLLPTRDLSTSAIDTDGTSSELGLTPVPSTTIYETLGGIPDIGENEFFGHNVAIVSHAGYGVEARDQMSGKKLWEVDFNPENDPLAGAPPWLEVYEIGDVLLAATSRLGLWAIQESNGRVYWRLPYRNIDAVPRISRLGKNLIVAPASDLPPNHPLELPAARRKSQ